jgi:inorganic pyrophosphatase
MKVISSILIVFMLCSCSLKNLDYKNIPTYSDNGYINMVVEIPSGTNNKIEYNKITNKFNIDIQENKKRKINFLPYPANYGFIPSTYMSYEYGGDGDPLDVLLISKNLNTGNVIEIIPVAILVMNDNGENDSKIIAVPKNNDLQIIHVNSYEDLVNNYIAIKEIIELWFINYKGNGLVEFVEWKDEYSAQNEIKRWLN